MPALRINRDDKIALAIDDLLAIAADVDGLDIEPSGRETVAIQLKRRSWLAHVSTADAVGVNDAQALTSSDRRGAQLVVANEVSEEARRVLEAADWSWLDRRAGLYLTHGPALAYIRLSPADGLIGHGRGLATLANRATATPASDGPIRGRAGISYAASVLCHPENPPSIRRVASTAGMSPSAVGEAAKLLRDEGLIDKISQPRNPELFSALAAIWQPERVTAVASLPHPDSAGPLRHHIHDLDEEGWALGGDLAAVAWGAPLFTTDAPPWLWVPSQTEARRAERALGTAAWDDRAAAIAVAPTPLVCHPRFHAPASTSEWPTTHPVFIALDLARDQGRGREILYKWNPEGIIRVW